MSLVPATGGLFLIEIQYLAAKGDETGAETETETEQAQTKTKTITLWDRKTEGGFPETKELKRRVRDCVDPGRDLGHVDRTKDAAVAAVAVRTSGEQVEANTAACGDCVF